MKLNAYSIYDRKALQYHPPFFKPQDGSALRDFSDLCNDGQTTIGRHPNDYVLFCIGIYNDADGSLVNESPLRHVADGQALVRPQPSLFPGPFSEENPPVRANGTANDDHHIKGA